MPLLETREKYLREDKYQTYVQCGTSLMVCYSVVYVNHNTDEWLVRT